LFNGTNAKLGHDCEYDLDAPYAQQTLAKTLEFFKMRSQLVHWALDMHSRHNYYVHYYFACLIRTVNNK
jgi:hypothetical protein